VTPVRRKILLETHELSRRYGPVVALDNLDLSVAAGQCVAMMGPNGSGKTTAAELICGLQEPTSGRVRIAGYSIHHEPEAIAARRRLAYVPDTPRLYADLTVIDHLHLVAAAHGAAGDDLDDRCEMLLDRLDLTDRADFFPSQLSRGMRQKTGIACALIRPFSVLVLDEPVEGLDADAIETLREIVLASRRAGQAVLLMTHNEEFAASVANRMLRIHEGRVLDA
jgi:ABC-2 type transport system ATP-binding protein